MAHITQEYEYRAPEMENMNNLFKQFCNDADDFISIIKK